MMRKFIYVFVCVCLLSACSDFLKEEDKDQIIPRTVEHYTAMLQWEAVNKITQNYYTDFMTDDITENAKAQSATKNTYKSLYTWQRDIEVDGNGSSSMVNNYWELSYRLILVCNYVMENIGNATGSASERDYVRGEALFTRAKCYFELINLYAKPYDPSTASVEQGVPRRFGTGVEEGYKRASVAAIYEIIEKDLKDAIVQFTNSGLKKSLWHSNAQTARLLLSRVYLYKLDWDNCIDYATQVIRENNGMLWNLANHQGTFVNTTNPEILNTYGDPSVITSTSGDMNPPKIYAGNGSMYGISPDISKSFLQGDLRPQLFIMVVSGVEMPAKWSSRFTALGAFHYRVSEAYLNRAEAYACKDMDDEAYKDVEYLVKNRVADIDAVTIPKKGMDLKSFIFDERRREFCFENFRWFDLKRTRLFGKQIEHRFTLISNTGTTIGSESYILTPNDPNYVLPIPQKEMDSNTLMEQNNRVDKLPIVEN